VEILDHPTVTPGGVLGEVVGVGSLGTDVVDYLDNSGNADGTIDVGDLRAFLRRTGG
jgi:hypothetical protein